MLDESNEMYGEMRYDENKNPFEENRMFVAACNVFHLNPWMIPLVVSLDISLE